MRLPGTPVFSVLWLAVASAGLRADSGMNAEADRIARLIRQLGDASFARRESAGKELVTIGEKTLPALRAATASQHLETRRRAERVQRSVMLGLRTSKSTGLELALIDAGEFMMGSLATERGRRPDELQHRVRITRPFLMGKFEVTQDDYRKVMNASPSWFAKTGEGAAKVAGMDTARFPVENVTWFDAVEFCNRLSVSDGYPPYYRVRDIRRDKGSIASATVTVIGGHGFRLPTEAEWEFACRASSRTWFHFGSTNTGRDANTRPGPAIGYGGGPDWEPLGRPGNVGSYKPNLWGLHDMHGNVAEWCNDWYEREYYAHSPEADPPGPAEGRHRVQRGGSWMVAEGSCRSASRALHTPDERTYYSGFRVARTPQ